MQLQFESNPTLNTVTAYGQDYIEINAVTYQHAVYFGPEGSIKEWAVNSVADINKALLLEVAGLSSVAVDPMSFLDGNEAPQKPIDAPEIILVGTGSTQQFLPPNVTQSLTKMNIGVETMSTQAATRTYNILMSEGRRVIAALLPLEPT